MRRVRKPLIAVRLPADLLQLLDEEVRRRPHGQRAYYKAGSRSAVVRDALRAFLKIEWHGRS